MLPTDKPVPGCSCICHGARGLNLKVCAKHELEKTQLQRRSKSAAAARGSESESEAVAESIMMSLQCAGDTKRQF